MEDYTQLWIHNQLLQPDPDVQLQHLVLVNDDNVLNLSPSPAPSDFDHVLVGGA